MCLVTRQIAPMKAHKPITCYKVFGQKETSETLLITPYQKMWMSIGQEEKQKFLMPKTIESRFGKRKHIGEGFFHAYTNEQEALRSMEISQKFNTRLLVAKYVTVECEIPKGSHYFKSVSGREICSTCIKPIKIIHIGNESDKNS